ncbi:YcaO-like family protein [Kitasatospora sp. NPDC058032]|uniref:YcaO-like family protein n=1 Tax=Kitasatospora sp. NPDC058032 TaxID=3346307 RepID=UPI0036D8E54F
MPADRIDLEGTVRARAPQETWALLAARLPRFGITRVARLTGLDYLQLPVWTAIRPAAQTLSASQGKGATDTLARISAVMEAIELWHVEQPMPVVLHGPAREVDPPYDLAELAPRLRHPGLDRVPLDWTTGTALGSGSTVAVPLDLIRRRARRPDWEPDLFRATSNGLACGNTRHEATLHALFEVVERDALFADEIEAGGRRTLVDPASVEDPYCRSLIDRMLAAHAALELVFVANAYAVPVCLAYLWTEDYPLTFAGAGCHTDPRIALSRALTEAAQSRLTCIAGTRDDLPGHEPAFDTEPPRPALAGELSDWTALTAPCEPAAGTFADQVDLLAERITRVTGHQPVRLDLSAPDEPFAAVKVLAPGTRSRIRRSVPR